MLLDAYDTLPARQWLGPYLPDRAKGWRERRKRQQLSEFLASETKQGLAQTYQNYIHSPKWKYFARQIIISRGSMCERCGCGTNRRLTVHHLSYIRLSNELPEDVKVYCWPCHKLMHPEKHSS